MPVAWLVTQLPANSPFLLGQGEGFCWNGSVRQVAWSVASERLELGRLAWKWLPGELLNGRLGFNIELGQAETRLKGILFLGRDGKHLQKVQGKLDAAILGYVSRPLSLLQPQGTLELDIPDLHLTPQRIHGEARLDWQARSSLIAAPLGDYRAELRANPDGRGAHFTMHTMQGALTINGAGDYTPGKGAEGNLTLTPPQDERRRLYTPVLGLLGQADASGAWRLNLGTH